MSIRMSRCVDVENVNMYEEQTQERLFVLLDNWTAKVHSVKR